MRRLRLRFEDSELEGSFLAKEGRDVLPSVRLGLLAALGLTLAFVAIDALVAEHQLLQAELIHAANMVAIVGLVWATYRPWWISVQRTGLTIVVVGTAWTWSLMAVVGGFPTLYIALGVPLLMVWLAALFRVGPLRTAVGSLFMLPALAATFAALDASTETWVLTVAYLANFYSLAVLTAYLLERASRRAFLQQRMIRRYAPPAVADRLEVGDTTVDAAQRRRVTVFSSDVVGFTVMADRLDPEALAEVINDYIAALADLLDRHHGTVTEFAGDGMMALFGAPDDLDPETQVRSAVAAAHELHAALPQWSKRWYRLGITEPLQARVGINTGVVSVGTFGSSVRATYTGIGIQMNIAARIQAEAAPGNTLISNTSWHLIHDTIECRSHGDVPVKGVHYPIEMYEPMHV